MSSLTKLKSKKDFNVLSLDEFLKLEHEEIVPECIALDICEKLNEIGLNASPAFKKLLKLSFANFNRNYVYSKFSYFCDLFSKIDEADDQKYGNEKIEIIFLLLDKCHLIPSPTLKQKILTISGSFYKHATESVHFVLTREEYYCANKVPY